jgi:hypothetical protein
MRFVPLAAVTDGIATRLQRVDTLKHLSRQVTNCLVVAGDACGLEQRWIGGEACMCVWEGGAMSIYSHASRQTPSHTYRHTMCAYHALEMII